MSGTDEAGVSSGRHRSVDALACMVALVLGALFLSPELRDTSEPLAPAQIGLDVAGGAVAAATLWWRRQTPLAVALASLALGIVSISATPAGLLALFSLAVHRPPRTALVATALWVPAVLLFAVYSPTTGPLAALSLVMPFALAAAAWGMWLRARRQLLVSLEERARRAEADRQLHEDRARMAERTRIAREMHDVLAHRISLMALHAGGLEVRPDLPADDVRATAVLLRATARQALEELRSVIGVLREERDAETSHAPQPSLSDVGRLVEERRRAGAEVELELRVEDPDAVPDALGRDAYRIIQESLTNISKHAPGAVARVKVAGAPGRGLHVSVRNRRQVGGTDAIPGLPGAGAGLLGLHERVTLAGGTLVHGPDPTGEFVVEAELGW